MITGKDKYLHYGLSKLRLAKLLTYTIAALPIALTTAFYSVSFAVIVYGASVPSSLDLGIALTLLGSATAVVTTGLLGSLRGTITHAQDATALLLAGAIASMNTGMSVTQPENAQFATVLGFVALVTVLSGALIYLSGRYRLSYAARFMPYPVISGLLVSIGYLLSVSSVGLITHEDISIFSLPRLAAEGKLLAWAPWAVGAFLMIIVGRWMSPSRVLPLGIFLGVVSFFGLMMSFQISLTEANRLGLLLGPFPDQSRLTDLSIAFFAEADWPSIFLHLPLVAAVVPLAVVSGVLNIQGIAQATGANNDLDVDVKAMGLSNIASGCVGGLICYPAVSTTLLGRHMNVPNVIIWSVTGLACVVFALFGTSLLGMLPRGLFAMVVLYLGLGLLRETLLKDAGRLPPSDFVLVLLILGTTAFYGVFPALVLGITISIAIFIVSYARLPFLRSDSTLAVRRSIVERSESNDAVLKSEGRKVRVLELTGSLFFGTAFSLRQHIRAMIATDHDSLHTMIIDFTRVRDVDTSALFSLERTLIDCNDHKIELYLSGVRSVIQDRFRRFASTQDGASGPTPRMFDTLDAALQKIEAEVLQRYFSTVHADDMPQSFLDELSEALNGQDLSDIFPIVFVGDGEIIIKQGTESNEIFILLAGCAVATVDDKADHPLVVARFEPGALIGEMAYYLGSPRTATITADGDTQLTKIDLSQLENNEKLPRELVSRFHLIAAKHLAQRLARATKLLRSALR